MLIGEGTSLQGAPTKGADSSVCVLACTHHQRTHRPYSRGGPVPASRLREQSTRSRRALLNSGKPCATADAPSTEDSHLMANADNGLATPEIQTGIQPGAPGRTRSGK